MAFFKSKRSHKIKTFKILTSFTFFEWSVKLTFAPMKKIIFFFLLFTSTLVTKAQDQINFNGKILSSNGFVYNANVINKKIFKGSVSDFEGNFSLMVNKGDVITFSSIGYKDFLYTIPDTITDKNFRVIVQMIVDTVQIGETVVTPWPLKKDFSRAFMNEKPKTEKEAISAYAGFVELEGDPKEPKPTILNPISFIANVFSKKRIQQKKMEKYRQMLNEDWFQKIISFYFISFAVHF